MPEGIKRFAKAGNFINQSGSGRDRVVKKRRKNQKIVCTVSGKKRKRQDILG